MHLHRLPIVFLVGLAFAVGSGCTASTPNPPVETSSSVPSVLGPDDIIEVQVYLEKGLSGVYRIDVDGSLTYPLVGQIQVAGLTASEIALTLRNALSEGYLTNPQVAVFVKEFNSRKITIIGQIKKPGRYEFRDGMTLVEAIALAGGTTDSAILRVMQVTRRQPETC